MIWTPNQIIGCRFENSPNNANGDAFTEVGSVSYTDFVFGRGLETNNTNAFVNLGANYVGSRCNGATGLTASCWVSLQGITGDTQRICIFWIGSTRSFFTLDRIGGDIRMSARSEFNDGLLTLFGDPLNLDEKTHIAAVADFENDTMRIYKDGILSAEDTNVGFGRSDYQHTTTSRDDTISGRIDTDQGFRGEIDEFNLYKTALSVADIRRVMHGFHPLNG